MARKNDRTDVLDVIEVMEVQGCPLKGMRICVTGHMAKPRAEIVRLIEQGGGEFHPAVKWHTTHLLTNEDWSRGTVDRVSSKYRKAQQQGCKIINEEQFLALLSGL